VNILSNRKFSFNRSGRLVTSVLASCLFLQNAIVFANEIPTVFPKPGLHFQLSLDVKVLSDQQRCVQVTWVSTMDMPEQAPNFFPSENVTSDLGLQCASQWAMNTSKQVRYFRVPGGLFEPFTVTQHWQLDGDLFTATAHWPVVPTMTSKQSFSVGDSQPTGGYHVIRIGEGQ
jgi:hypothetical protein